jgi:hypothetical protein
MTIGPIAKVPIGPLPPGGRGNIFGRVLQLPPSSKFIFLNQKYVNPFKPFKRDFRKSPGISRESM